MKIKIPKTNSLVAVSLYIIISVLVFTYGLLNIHTNGINNFLVLVLGILFFTLIEYVAHRFLYHSGKDYKDEANWQYTVHGIHHDHPRDEGLLAMPIILAMILAAIFFLLFYFIMAEYTYFFWPGFFLGYAVYLYIHYIVHAQKPPKNIFRYLWRHHAIHHYLYENKAYGVSSPIWDIIFGTMPPKKNLRK